jgi:hypothetical protein
MKVDANTTSPRRQNENLLLALGILKVINPKITLMRRRLSINSTIPISTNSKHVIQDVHELRHLAEDEYFAIFANELWNQVVEDFEFH